MADLLLLGSLFYFVSGKTIVTPGILTTVLLEFPRTKSETTTSSPDEDRALTTEIPTTVFSEFPDTKSEPPTHSPDHSNTVTEGKSTLEDCRLPGFLYRGTKRVTKSGLLCQRWDVQSPHKHNYFIFTLAQENYCRNFDREEPWCFTTNSRVRWELCGVEICSSQCLNTSFDTEKIESQCVAAEETGTEFCNRLWRIVGCLKNRLEIYMNVQCSGIESKSIALHRQDMLERLMGRSISQCIIAPCADSGVKSNKFEDSSLFAATRFFINVYSCFLRYDLLKSTIETLCANVQRVVNCVVSIINKETNSTCLTKDKVSMARLLADINPPYAAFLNICKPNISEFPLSTEGISKISESPLSTEGISKISEFPLATEDLSSVIQQDMTGKLDQTQLFISIGSTIVVLFVGILIFSVLATRATRAENETPADKERMSVASYLDLRNLESNYLEVMQSSKKKMLLKKRRKELLRLPSLPKIQESPYEVNFASATDNYIDPDYEMIEEQDEGYKHLGEQRGGSYIDPNNADGTYLDVVPTPNDKSDGRYININPYIEVIDDSTENNSITEASDEVPLPLENSENSHNLTSN